LGEQYGAETIVKSALFGGVLLTEPTIIIPNAIPQSALLLMMPTYGVAFDT
jgi:hypothetical protein